jgi:hypothetical protein
MATVVPLNSEYDSIFQTASFPVRRVILIPRPDLDPCAATLAQAHLTNCASTHLNHELFRAACITSLPSPAQNVTGNTMDAR